MALAAPGGRRRRGGGRWRGRGRGRGRSKGPRGGCPSSSGGFEFEPATVSDEEDSLYGGDDEDSMLSSGGYDYDFVGDVPASLQCLICTLPSREAQQVSCCGKIFCLSCLVILKKSKSTGCPNCRRQAWTSFADQRSDRDILSLTVKCSNLGSSCSWRGELRALKNHMIQCLRPCKYAPMGCLVRMLRENLVLHEEECIVERLKTAMDRIQALERQLKPLLMPLHGARSIASPMASCAPATFQFKGDLVQGKEVPFYSHPTGYKFILSIKFNGGTNYIVSIRVHLMRGEHDASLSWPFRGVVNFEMLNQEDNRGHKQGSAKFKQRKPTLRNRRVPPGLEKNEEGWGDDFIIDQVHFLSDGFLYIRVSEVMVEGLSKPWLCDRLVVVHS